MKTKQKGKEKKRKEKERKGKKRKIINGSASCGDRVRDASLSCCNGRQIGLVQLDIGAPLPPCGSSYITHLARDRIPPRTSLCVLTFDGLGPCFTRFFRGSFTHSLPSFALFFLFLQFKMCLRLWGKRKKYRRKRILPHLNDFQNMNKYVI